MATLKEIQKKVAQAQEEISNGNVDYVKVVIWPEIRDALGQCTDLEWKYRGGVAKLIYKYLNEQGLVAEPTPINVGQLKADLEAGKVKVPEPAEVYRWLTW